MKIKSLIFIVYLGFISVYIYKLQYYSSVDAVTSFLLFLNGMIIPCVYLKRKINIFEPLFWFSIYYYFLFLSSVWLVNTNFTESLLLQITEFYYPLENIFKLALLIILIGYISFLIGYELFINKTAYQARSNIKIHRNIKFSPHISILLIIIFVIIGSTNFLYNIKIVSNFSIVEYFQNIKYYGSYIGERYGLTTLGYQLYGIATFIGIYEFKRGNLNRFLCYTLILSYIVIYASKGRITQTITTIIIFFLANLYLNKKNINKKTIFTIGSFGLTAICLFFYRRFTELRRVYHIELNDFLEVLSPSKILFGGGNLPNIAALMKILDSWALDIGFLYGKTMPSGLFVFIPSFMKGDIFKGNTVSWISKNVWYQGDQGGGGIPPGILGDWYANFGYLGIVLGMFLLGVTFSKIYNYVLRKDSYILLVFYLFFLMKFVFILPKGEFSRLSYILEPTLILITWEIIKYLTFLARKKKSSIKELQLI
jgi:oligosaccharide repeat unit polymerase